jgi:hypothetical protein
VSGWVKRTINSVMLMKLFSFKNEAKWIMIFSFGLPAIGFLILLVVFLAHRF